MVDKYPIKLFWTQELLSLPTGVIIRELLLHKRCENHGVRENVTLHWPKLLLVTTTTKRPQPYSVSNFIYK